MVEGEIDFPLDRNQMALGSTNNVIRELIIAASSRSATSGRDSYIHDPTTPTTASRTGSCKLSITIDMEATGSSHAE
jgi:hypothetical protein